ncbi:sodium channel protein para isoform X3 [Folsomia candida]|nr:sodium channel protein para isoform X3 [Folsomia candida]
MGINLGNLAALRTFRVLRALKTVAIVPGLKTIVGAVIESVKNLRDVIILTMFGLGVFALIGLQIYMGVLTQRCTLDFEEDGSENEERDLHWKLWNQNKSHWWIVPGTDETQLELNGYYLCGNATGAGQCPENYTCLQGFGPNPNYNYTSFDSFGWAFLSAFRLMTQDFWESLYQQILQAAGPWHILFFIVIIFLGSYYLVNLILAIVAMSYDELQKKAEEDELAAAAEFEAMRAEDDARAARAAVREERDAARAEDAERRMEGEGSGGGGSPSGTETVGGSRAGGLNKTSMSVPGSPYVERSLRGASSRMVLSTYLDAQQHLPFADDSAAATPMSEENGAIILTHHYSFHGNGQNFFQPSFGGLSSYNSHASRVSYTSHDLLTKRHPNAVITKESQLLQRMNEHKQFADGGSSTCRSMLDLQSKKDRAMSAAHTEYQQPNNVLDMNDVLVLNDIIEQAAGHRAPHSRLSDVPPSEMIPERIPFKELLKQKIIEGCFRCIDIFCVWDCGFPWSLFKKIIAFIVFDPFMELFITLAIVVNTVFMALDHYGLEENYFMDKMLKTGNTIFTTIFTVECAMKLVAMSPKFYFQFGWNVFDFIIVALSLIEKIFEDANLPGISALRSFRLLRVFKLAKSWPTLNLLISIMGKTMGALGNLVFVFIIIVFIFAVMGMQLFAKNYFDKVSLFPGGEMPRWNFTDFGHSFMIIFRVLCGEWIESMWDCMLVTGPACVPFFLATVVIGNLVVLNLFLALLLSSFGASNLSVPTADAETNKLAEAFARIGRFNRWVKGLIRSFFMGIINCFICAKNRVLPRPPPPPPEPEPEPEIQVKRRPRLAETARLVMNSKKLMNDLKRLHPAGEDGTDGTGKDNADTLSMASYGSHNYITSKPGVQRRGPKGGGGGGGGGGDGTDTGEKLDGGEDEVDWCDDDLEDAEDEEGEGEDGEEQVAPHVVKVEEPEEEYPADCMPPRFYERLPIFQCDDTPFGVVWINLRLKTFRLIENKYFETAVITMILLSSLALALEDVHLPSNPILTDILFYMDRIFTVIFFFEMLIKWLALGFVSYFTNAWCWLDFVIVMVSLINFVAALLGFGSVQAFKTMRTLRALRPLRAMSRMQGMRIVVNALVQAIPSIFNVLLVCLIFWLIFAIMGVQLFNGKYHYCVDPVDGVEPDYRIIENKLECLANNFSWINRPQTFDHVGKAYLCLFQVATFKGWMPIMYAAIDAREINQQPVKEHNFAMYIYFVVFIVFGSFFTLNLFIGVIIDNFNEQKKKSGGSMEMFMTEDQKKYYAAMKKMGSKKPVKAVPRPSWRPQAIVFEIVTHQKFDMIIMLFIGINMVTMTMDHYQQTQIWDDVLNIFNAIFIAIFSAECFSKIFALRHHYFTEPWNLFDFVVVLMSIAGMMLSDLIEKYFVSPTLLRVVRVAKVGRVLRLVKGAKGIRTLLFALAMSLPALFNICLLLFLVMFIFSIFGMSFFKDVKLREGLTEVYNFQTFGQSIILLFQMSTSAGWAEVLAGIIKEDECELPDTDLGTSGNCGNATVGIAFLLAYLVMTFLIIINMYIAVILENYSQATEEVQEGLTDDDYDMYYEIWAQFDPDGSQYIRYDQLSDFLDVLEPPMQIHKPNKYKIISMDIPICKGDMMYCVDILDALTRDFFARKGNAIDEAVEVNEVQVAADRPGYEPVSSTLWRQREEYCARLIQNAWRRHKNVGVGGAPDSATKTSEQTDVVVEAGAPEDEPDEVLVITTGSGSPTSPKEPVNV